MMINPKFFNLLESIAKQGKRVRERPLSIFELGSGYGTNIMCEEGYDVVSVEESSEWAFRYHDNYILCPIDKETEWYDREILKEGMKKYKDRTFDVLLVDGPSSARDRLLENLDLFSALSFNTLVVDDVDRPGEMKLVTAMVNHLYKQYKDQIDLVVIHSDSIGANLLNPFIAVRTRPKNKKK